MNLEDNHADKELASPMLQCPTEILSEIFIHALPASPFTLSTSHAPLLLERVCRQWRDVTRSTPALWSQIAVDLLDGFQEFDIKIASICLTRSGKHPLAVTLGRHAFDPNVASGPHPALALLATECERWHAVHLRLPLETFSELSVVRGRLPLLHSLFVDIDNEGSDTTVTQIFGPAPRLRHFNDNTWQYFIDDTDTIISARLPWSDLTSLIIQYERKAVDVWAILQGCTSLVEIEVLISGDTRNGHDDVPHVKLPFLRSLSLQLPESSTILSTLTLPVLNDAFLTLHEGVNYTPSKNWHVSSGFATLLSQSRCSLLKMRLHEGHARRNIVFGLPDLVALMAALPTLTELDVSRRFSTIFCRLSCTSRTPQTHR